MKKIMIMALCSLLAAGSLADAGRTSSGSSSRSSSSGSSSRSSSSGSFGSSGRSSAASTPAVRPPPTSRPSVPTSRPSAPASAPAKPPSTGVSGAGFGGAARSPAASARPAASRAAQPSTNSVRPRSKPVRAAKPVKRSDCDAGDLIEGDVADCGARAIPGAIATGAAAVVVATGDPYAALGGTVPTPAPVAAQTSMPLWVMVVFGLVFGGLLLAALVSVVRRRGRGVFDD